MWRLASRRVQNRPFSPGDEADREQEVGVEPVVARMHVRGVRVVGVRQQDLAAVPAGRQGGEQRRVDEGEAQHRGQAIVRIPRPGAISLSVATISASFYHF